MTDVRDPIGDARHQASRTRGMILATSLVAAAFAVAWWRHHQAEVAHVDPLDRLLRQPTSLPPVTNAGPSEATRALCRHIVDCSNAPADERAGRVADCMADRQGAVSADCITVSCDQLAACLARAAP
ncbi:MAG TPA: hypothetical protein VMJ10_28040 [Kofleriaceae bacterium]|nr:hypothetical protein [Kofleriaceae bacterium]